MSDEQQPELRWAPLPPAKRDKSRVWLIVALVIAALVLAAVVVLFLIPRQQGAAPTPSPSASASITPPTTTRPTTAPTATPPPIDRPDLGAFAAQVRPRLDDAMTGLDLLSGMSGQDAVQVVDQLQQDAERLSDAVAPDSISVKWYDGVSAYSSALGDLRAAYEDAANAESDHEKAAAKLTSLRELIGI